MSPSRLRRDDSGFTLAMTMVVMFLTLTFVGLAVSMALAGLTHSETARSVERAQAAADAGADIAGYRMNKTLLAPTDASLLGLSSSVLQTAGCTGVDLTFGNSTSIADANSNASVTAANPTGGLLTLAGIPAGNNFCRTQTSENVDDNSSYRYAISTSVLIGPALSTTLTAQGLSVSDLSKLIIRQVASIGESGGQTRRVIVSYWLGLPSALSGSVKLSQLFMKKRYIRCPALPIGTTDPFANCPNNPGY